MGIFLLSVCVFTLYKIVVLCCVYLIQNNGFVLCLPNTKQWVCVEIQFMMFIISMMTNGVLV